MASNGSSEGTAEPLRARALQEGFLAALQRHPTLIRQADYAFAGRSVRLRVVGAGLGKRSHRAFSHLRIARAPAPTLAIDLWDETETAVRALDDAGASDLDRQWIACDGLLTASRDGRYVSFRYQDSVTMLDRHAQRMLGCRRNGAHLSGGEYSKPLLMMLSIWYHDRGVQLLHTGLIAADGAGVLVPGESGSGKSTTSLAGLVDGLEFLGDDFVGLERGGDGFVGHSVFGTACVHQDNLRRFPSLESLAVEDDDAIEEKAILFLPELFPDRLRASVPVRAVALPRIGAERTEIVPARCSEALRHFAASTLHTVVPRPGRDALQLLAELVEKVPTWWLHLGPDPRDVRHAIERIVRTPGRHAA
jgi:hypothetical protein